MHPQKIREVKDVIAASVKHNSMPTIRKMLEDLLGEREMLLTVCKAVAVYQKDNIPKETRDGVRAAVAKAEA